MKRIFFYLIIILFFATNGWCLTIDHVNSLYDKADVGGIDTLLTTDLKTTVDTFGGAGITNTEKEEAWVNSYLTSINSDPAIFYEIDKIDPAPYYSTSQSGVYAFFMTEPPVSDYFIVKNAQGYALYDNTAFTNWGVFDTNDSDFIDALKLPSNEFQISHVTRSKSISPVPEPTTMLLFGTGIAGLAAVCRRRKK